MAPPVNVGRSKERKQEIMNAVETEERFLRVYYGYILPPDQIRGKALQRLGIPSKTGGQIDWSEVGSDLTTRIVPRPDRSTNVAPSKRFFKSRPSRPPGPLLPRELQHKIRSMHDTVIVENCLGPHSTSRRAAPRSRSTSLLVATPQVLARGSSSAPGDRRLSLRTPARTLAPARTSPRHPGRPRRPGREQTSPGTVPRAPALRPKRKLFRVSSGDNPETAASAPQLALTPSPAATRGGQGDDATNEDALSVFEPVSSPEDINKPRSKPVSLCILGPKTVRKSRAAEVKARAKTKADEMVKRLLLQSRAKPTVTASPAKAPSSTCRSPTRSVASSTMYSHVPSPARGVAPSPPYSPVPSLARGLTSSTPLRDPELSPMCSLVPTPERQLAPSPRHSPTLSPMCTPPSSPLRIPSPSPPRVGRSPSPCNNIQAVLKATSPALSPQTLDGVVNFMVGFPSVLQERPPRKRKSLSLKKGVAAVDSVKKRICLSPSPLPATIPVTPATPKRTSPVLSWDFQSKDTVRLSADVVSVSAEKREVAEAAPAEAATPTSPILSSRSKPRPAVRARCWTSPPPRATSPGAPLFARGHSDEVQTAYQGGSLSASIGSKAPPSNSESSSPILSGSQGEDSDEDVIPATPPFQKLSHKLTDAPSSPKNRSPIIASGERKRRSGSNQSGSSRQWSSLSQVSQAARRLFGAPSPVLAVPAAAPAIPVGLTDHAGSPQCGVQEPKTAVLNMSMASSATRVSIGNASFAESAEDDYDQEEHHVSVREAAEKALQAERMAWDDLNTSMAASSRSSGGTSLRRQAQAKVEAAREQQLQSDSDSADTRQVREKARLNRREIRRCFRASTCNNALVLSRTPAWRHASPAAAVPDTLLPASPSPDYGRSSVAVMTVVVRNSRPETPETAAKVPPPPRLNADTESSEATEQIGSSSHEPIATGTSVATVTTLTTLSPHRGPQAAPAPAMGPRRASELSGAASSANQDTGASMAAPRTKGARASFPVPPPSTTSEDSSVPNLHSSVFQGDMPASRSAQPAPASTNGRKTVRCSVGIDQRQMDRLAGPVGGGTPRRTGAGGGPVRTKVDAQEVRGDTPTQKVGVRGITPRQKASVNIPPQDTRRIPPRQKASVNIPPPDVSATPRLGIVNIGGHRGADVAAQATLEPMPTNQGSGRATRPNMSSASEDKVQTTPRLDEDDLSNLTLSRLSLESADLTDQDDAVHEGSEEEDETPDLGPEPALAPEAPRRPTSRRRSSGAAQRVQSMDTPHRPGPLQVNKRKIAYGPLLSPPPRPSPRRQPATPRRRPVPMSQSTSTTGDQDATSQSHMSSTSTRSRASIGIDTWNIVMGRSHRNPYLLAPSAADSEGDDSTALTDLYSPVHLEEPQSPFNI